MLLDKQATILTKTKHPPKNSYRNPSCYGMLSMNTYFGGYLREKTYATKINGDHTVTCFACSASVC